MGTLRDQILAADDLPREQVDTPEWGVDHVWIRGMTAAERDAYEQSLTERGPDGSVRPKRSMRNLRAAFVVRILVDEDGERIFSDADADALGDKNAALIDRLWEKGRVLSGLDGANPSRGDQDEPNSSESPSPSE